MNTWRNKTCQSSQKWERSEFERLFEAHAAKECVEKTHRVTPMSIADIGSKATTKPPSITSTSDSLGCARRRHYSSRRSVRGSLGSCWRNFVWRRMRARWILPSVGKQDKQRESTAVQQTHRETARTSEAKIDAPSPRDSYFHKYSMAEV